LPTLIFDQAKRNMTMLTITQDLLTSRKNRPALRSDYYKIKKMKGVVIHWTANPFKGAGAKANRNYFNRGERFASAHYCVDDDSIIQCLPDDELGYHVGAKSYRPTGQKLMQNGLNPNYFLIGIEMCINYDSDWNKTYQNTIDLTKHLLNKFNLTTNDLYRHYDITGKDCPKMMLDQVLWNKYKDDLKKQRSIDLDIPYNTWEQFKRDINNEIEVSLPDVVRHGMVNTIDLNVRKGPGTQFDIVRKVSQGMAVTIYEEVGNWFRIGDNEWVGKLYIVIKPPERAAEIVTSTTANVRKGAGSAYQVIRSLQNGDMITLLEDYNGWHRIGANEWVHSSLVKTLTITYGRVQVSEYINVRTGPGTQFPKVKTLPNDTVIKIYEIENGFARLGDDEWVNNSFVIPIA
jgi:N-acetylmuramoyl-L-alanine amidase